MVYIEKKRQKEKEKTNMINYVKDSEAICSNLVNSNTFENKMRIFNKQLERQNKIKKNKTKANENEIVNGKNPIKMACY